MDEYGIASTDDPTNPFIAFADVGVNLVIVLVFVIVAIVIVSHPGWESLRYQQVEKRFALAAATLPGVRPQEIHWKNDPPGAQRWMYANYKLFSPGTAELRPEGRSALIQFARLLRAHENEWRRISIEGHSILPQGDAADNWALWLLSAQRAIAVAEVFVDQGGIKPWLLSISGRGPQDPLDSSDPSNSINERVEIIVEYAQTTATGVKLIGSH